jgi:hypothetical protein
MKRSEMEHKVKEWLVTNEGTQAVDIPRLLNFLESKGMLPPAYKKFVEAQGVASPSPDIKLYYKLPCNEWEPEND